MVIAKIMPKRDTDCTKCATIRVLSKKCSTIKTIVHYWSFALAHFTMPHSILYIERGNSTRTIFNIQAKKSDLKILLCIICPGSYTKTDMAVSIILHIQYNIIMYHSSVHDILHPGYGERCLCHIGGHHT